jgi:site-specific DNA recombinase
VIGAYHYCVSKSEARFGAPGKGYEHLPAPEIEGAVVAQIRTVLTSPATVASVVRHIQRNGAQIDEATTVMAMGRLNSSTSVALYPLHRGLSPFERQHQQQGQIQSLTNDGYEARRS